MKRPADLFGNGMRIAWLLTACVLLMAGCAGLKQSGESPVTYDGSSNAPDGLWPDKELEGAFRRYWGLRFAGKVEEAFSVEAPYFQEMTGIARYRLYVQHAQKNMLLGIDVKGATKETERFVIIKCVARIKTQAGETNETFLLDRWVHAGARWYHVIKDPFMFPARK
jgi:hypothetical protein